MELRVEIVSANPVTKIAPTPRSKKPKACNGMIAFPANKKERMADIGPPSVRIAVAGNREEYFKAEYQSVTKRTKNPVAIAIQIRDWGGIFKSTSPLPWYRTIANKTSEPIPILAEATVIGERRSKAFFDTAYSVAHRTVARRTRKLLVLREIEEFPRSSKLPPRIATAPRTTRGFSLSLKIRTANGIEKINKRR